METRVLVAYGTKYGATAGIAEKIGQVLRDAGLVVDVKPAGDAGDVGSYQAVVLGSAVYIGKWRKEAAEFLRDNEKALAQRPVWIFNSGPLGEGNAAEQAGDLGFPKRLRPIADRIKARDIAVFFGAVDLEKLNPLERWMFKNVKSPIGDFRNWDAITAWAAGIAQALKASQGAGEGPLEDGELERAQAWAKGIGSTVRTG